MPTIVLTTDLPDSVFVAVGTQGDRIVLAVNSGPHISERQRQEAIENCLADIAAASKFQLARHQ